MRPYITVVSAILVSSLYLSGYSSGAFAAQVYVEAATGSGVSPGDLETATELVKSAVPQVSPESVSEQPNQAAFTLRPRLLRLGQAYVLTLAKIRDGQVVYSSQLKAERMDELDKVATRLTRSVILGESAPATPRVGEITDEEANNGTQRRPVRKAIYLGFGGSEFSHLNSTGVGYSFGAAYSWDTNYVRIKLLGEGDVNGAAFFASGGIGGNYYFSNSDVAPYLSADFGGGVAKVDGGGVFSGQTVGGFVVGAGAGVELLRTSSVNLDLGFRAGVLLHANNYGMPEVYSLRLGLYF
jgi:hypothetical protein